MASATHIGNNASKQLAISYTRALLERFGDVGLYSEEELNFLLDGAWDLFLLDPDQKRFLEKLEQFFDELEERLKPPFEIGRCISEYLKK
jgi:hypothetical protein